MSDDFKIIDPSNENDLHNWQSIVLDGKTYWYNIDEYRHISKTHSMVGFVKNINEK